MIVIECEQRSPAWFAARTGVLTASVVADIYGTRKDGKETAARRDLRMRLALERITGQPQEDGYVNADMQRGIALEAEARTAYEMAKGHPVTEVGFCRHDTLPIGASPDGLIRSDGLLEIKCPRPGNHWPTIESQAIPSDYVPQLLHALVVTQLQFADFVSYCPVMPEPLRLCVLRYQPTDAERSAHELVVRQFLREVDETEAAIRRRME